MAYSDERWSNSFCCEPMFQKSLMDEEDVIGFLTMTTTVNTKLVDLLLVLHIGGVMDIRFRTEVMNFCSCLSTLLTHLRSSYLLCIENSKHLFKSQVIMQ